MEMEDYEKIAEFLSRLNPSLCSEVAEDGAFVVLKEYDEDFDDLLTSPVEGKLLEALECALVRECLPGELEEFNKEVTSLHAFQKGHGGWRFGKNGDSDVPDGFAQHCGCLRTDGWGYVAPGDGYAYDVADVWYNSFEMSADVGVFEAALEELVELAGLRGDSLLSYFRRGDWRRQALCSDSYFFDWEVPDYSMAAIMATAFYLYHLSVAPIPDEVMRAVRQEEVDFATCNRGAAKFLGALSPLGMPSWFDEDGPAYPTELERSMLSVAFGMMNGTEGVTGWFWKSRDVADYLDERMRLEPYERAVTDRLLSMATCGVREEELAECAVAEAFAPNEYWHAVCGRQDGCFYFSAALSRKAVPRHAVRLAFTAFRGAFALARQAIGKEGAA